MDNDIRDLKRIRIQLSLTQTELAKKTGVSQSLVAKIEAGKIDPSYSNAKKIFDFLDILAASKGITAGDVMKTSVISIKPRASTSSAIKKMKRHSISQLPVTLRGQIVGLVTESNLLDGLIGKKPIACVEDAMEQAPPSVPENASIKVVLGLLKFYSVVLVAEKGRLKGIITKSDLLGTIYR